MEPRSRNSDRLRGVQPLVLQPHQCLPLDIIVEVENWREQFGEHRMLHVRLADGTEREGERDARPGPALHQYGAAAVQVEHVAAVQLERGRARQRLRETDHAHVVRVLPQ